MVLNKEAFKIFLEIIGAITVSIVMMVLLFGGEFSLKINFHSVVKFIKHLKSKNYEQSNKHFAAMGISNCPRTQENRNKILEYEVQR